MPTNRRKRTRNSVLDQWKLDQLATGEFLVAGVGYAASISNGLNHWTAEDHAAVRDAMRADWIIHGPTIMATWAGPSVPWAAAEFDR